MKSKLNIILVIWLWFVIINHAVRIFNTLLRIQFSDSYTRDILIFQIVIGVLMIVVLAGIFHLKKQALYSFFVLEFLNSFIVWQMQGGRPEDYLVHFISAVIFSGFMIGLLFLKKDGRSGWDIINNGSIKDENKKI